MTDAPEREIAYQTYINEVMPNGNTRLDNIILCNAGDRAEQHIATQIDLAFQAGWSARAEASETRIAHLENHIEAVAKDAHKIMLQYDAALPAAYQLALADTYLSRDVLPDPTAAELMARIQTGENK